MVDLTQFPNFVERLRGKTRPNFHSTKHDMINVDWYEIPLQLRMTFKRGLRVQQRQESHVPGLCFCWKSEFNAYPGSDVSFLLPNDQYTPVEYVYKILKTEPHKKKKNI